MRRTLLRGGLVIDPETRTARVTDVEIADGAVAAVGDQPSPDFDGDFLDVAGLVVGPGFIDLHSHTHSIAGHRVQAFDGVTSALDLETGLAPIGDAYARASSEGRPLNFGFSASAVQARGAAHLGVAMDAAWPQTLALYGEPEWQRTSTSRERATWLATLEEELGGGALGIGVLLGYVPQSDPAEFLDVARLAARHESPVFAHVRELAVVDPGTPIDGSYELVAASRETGAHLHHCHVNSTSRRHVDGVLDMIGAAQANGARVTTECYPYLFGSTAISASFLDPERLSAWDLTPSSIVVATTGERVADVGRLRQLREADPGTPCFVEYMDERSAEDRDMLLRALAFPDSVVASDAMPISMPDGTTECLQWPLPAGARTHPRTAGTFMKTVRLMVRETATWDWVEAFRRCSLLPAELLRDVAPPLQRKGRLAPGADADLVVIDPDRCTDLATAANGATPSLGVRHLLVGGEFLIRDGALDETAFPGRPIRADGFGPRHRS